jgi:pilus assembly protein CpaD
VTNRKFLAIRTMCALGSIAAMAALLTPAPALADDEPANRGLESIHQPIVERTDFVFDARTDGGSLPAFEQGRLIGWFDAMNLGYGDRVSIVDGDGANSAVRDSVASLVARYGLLLAGEAPATVGRSGGGQVRLVISRATASVPSCPSWGDRAETDFNNRTGYNYGCAINSNLARMVADPIDLVEGRTTRSDLRVATSSRAIRTYQEKTPTGAGDLKQESAGGAK